MNEKVDKNLKEWLERLATEWDLPVEQVAFNVGDDEIANRVQNYPKVATALAASPFDLLQFSNAVRNCWVMAGRFDIIRFNAFVSNGRQSTTAILQLTENFPESDENAGKRIEEFLESAVLLGFLTPTGSFDWAGAASLSSLILTSLYPSRFVDFRRERWKRFSEAFGYGKLPTSASRGDWVIWAGKFAKEFCETRTYQKYWPQTERRLSNPLWVVAGICWTGLSPQKPLPEPIDPDILSFPEGAEKRRLHLTRERNRAIVAKAKAIGIEQDPMLRCQICGFSFAERYGQHGRGFIEAHHKHPVAELKPGSRTNLKDIALVCANCHRMLHFGDITLSIEELTDLLRGYQEEGI
jgi:hypothetical protein